MGERFGKDGQFPFKLCLGLAGNTALVLPSRAILCLVSFCSCVHEPEEDRVIPLLHKIGRDGSYDSPRGAADSGPC